MVSQTIVNGFKTESELRYLEHLQKDKGNTVSDTNNITKDDDPSSTLFSAIENTYTNEFFWPSVICLCLVFLAIFVFTFIVSWVFINKYHYFIPAK